MYRLATIHSVTDRQTGRHTDDSMMPIADHTACDSTIGWLFYNNNNTACLWFLLLTTCRAYVAVLVEIHQQPLNLIVIVSGACETSSFYIDHNVVENIKIEINSNTMIGKTCTH